MMRMKPKRPLPMDLQLKSGRRLSLPSTEPVFCAPGLLVQPNVPKPMHGTNPRTVLGAAWWDRERSAAKAANNNCCHACGLPAHRNQRAGCGLEGHERYEITYSAGRVKYLGTVALCNWCHAFIHCGLLVMHVRNKTRTQLQAMRIMRTRIELLHAADFTPHMHELMAACELGVISARELPGLAVKARRQEADRSVSAAPWGAWRLEIQGKLYEGKFPTKQDWERAYK